MISNMTLYTKNLDSYNWRILPYVSIRCHKWSHASHWENGRHYNKISIEEISTGGIDDTWNHRTGSKGSTGDRILLGCTWGCNNWSRCKKESHMVVMKVRPCCGTLGRHGNLNITFRVLSTCPNVEDILRWTSCISPSHRYMLEPLKSLSQVWLFAISWVPCKSAFSRKKKQCY